VIWIACACACVCVCVQCLVLREVCGVPYCAHTVITVTVWPYDMGSDQLEASTRSEGKSYFSNILHLCRIRF
jgi:hypothetical protein